MRVVKLVCCLGLVTVLAVVWRTHGVVVAAYTEERPPTEFRLTGGDLGFRPTPIEPSPFAVDLVPPDLHGVAVSPIAVSPLPANDIAGADSPLGIPPMGGGTAELDGSVSGPDGPVAGAVVLLERHVDDRWTEARVTTGDDGTWRVRSLLGGRFRARAFVPDLLADPEPQVFFLVDGEKRALSFDLQAPETAMQVSLHAADAHFHGLVAPAAVTVGREAVDAEGRWVLRPVAGARVTFLASGAASAATPAATTTDVAGVARFGVLCAALGPAQLTVTVASQAPPAASTSILDLPPCQSVPTPEELAERVTSSPPSPEAGDE